MKPLSLGLERNSIARPVALSLAICVMAPVLHAGWGSLIKSAAENAAKKAVKQKVEETVEEAVTDAISQPGKKEGSSAESAAMRAQKLATLNLETDTVDVPNLNFGSSFTSTAYVRKTLKKKPKVVVPGYRVVFALESTGYAGTNSGRVGAVRGAAAHGAVFAAGRGNARATGLLGKMAASGGGSPKRLFKKAVLDGISTQELQQIADQAYLHFLEELEACGYDYVAIEEIAESEAFKELEFTQAGPGVPYVQPGDDNSRSTYAAFSPMGLPLWFTHYDKTLGVGDKGPFEQKNWKALNALSVNTNAVILVPQICINFARIEDAPIYQIPLASGYLDFDIGVHLDPRVTSLSAYSAKAKIAGNLGAATLRKPLFLPYEFGVVKKIDEKSHRPITGVSMYGSWSVDSVQEIYAVTVQPEVFEALALAAAKAANLAFLENLR